ncbi:MAG: DUF3943 domain-containing protein [Thermoanaerobaculia bacterium]
MKDAARASRSPRRTARRAARFAAFALTAIAGQRLVADDAALGAGGREPVAFEGACPLFRSDGGTSASFGFGDGALGSGRPGWRMGPDAGFSLCSDAGAATGAERLEVRWETSRPRDPREPLRGVRNATAPHRKRLLRSSAILTGTAIASGAILALLPREETNWEEGAFDHGFSNLGRAWTSLPVWDRDEAFHDWFGHPYAGAFYYNMMRSQGATVGQSFAYSAAQSVVWEYVLEAAAEQPSIQDLISTPFIGAVVGELFHRWSVAILRRGSLNLGEKALVFLLNPSYVINNGYRAPE